jgi:excisionase family DNA binding protein
MRTLDIHECADFLKINVVTAYEMAAAGKLPGAKIGRSWVFLMDDLVEYLRGKVREQQAKRLEANALTSAITPVPLQVDKLDVVASYPALRRHKKKRVLPDLSRYELPDPSTS